MTTTIEMTTSSLVHDLTRDQEDTTYPKKAESHSSFLKENNPKICTKDDNLPNIEAVVSFSPNSSCSSRTSSPLMIRTNNNNEPSPTSPEVQLSIITEPSVTLWNHSFHDIDSTTTTVSSNDYYISKTDYDNDDHDYLETLLTQETLDQYEQYLEEEKREQSAERRLRRALIQKELAILIRATEENNELDGHEFEPEAIEALGVAANRVAYLKKYYNVAKCENVYVPSVAYTIMDGSLLEEASKHYFGRSEEFLVTYAAGLGSTIMELKRRERSLISLTPKSRSLTESLDLGDEGSDDYGGDDDYSDGDLENIEHSQLARLVWGVSPKVASPSNERGFTFNEYENELEEEDSDDAQCEVDQEKHNQLSHLLRSTRQNPRDSAFFKRSTAASKWRGHHFYISTIVCVFAIAYFQITKSPQYDDANASLNSLPLPELPNNKPLFKNYYPLGHIPPSTTAEIQKNEEKAASYSRSQETLVVKKHSSSDKTLQDAKPSLKQAFDGQKSPIVPNLLYY